MVRAQPLLMGRTVFGKAGQGGRLASASAAASAFARYVAVAAENRTVATRLKGHSGRLSAAGADHGRSLRRSLTIAATSSALVVFLRLAAGFAAFWGRKAALGKERLIGSGEGKILPTIAAS